MFLPTEDVYHKIHGYICKRHDLEVLDRKVFDRAMDSIMNHNVWKRMKDLTSQSLFSLTLISACQYGG